MDKHICIKRLYIGSVFEVGKIYNGRVSDFCHNISPNDNFTHVCSFTFEKRIGYDWLYSDYFISLAEYRDKQINEIIS